MKIPSAVAGGKNPLRNVKERYWYELLMQHCVAVALFPPKVLAERGEDTWLYDLGKSAQERRPAPLIFKELDLDTTLKENKFW